jgi:hypothetical protein
MSEDPVIQKIAIVEKDFINYTLIPERHQTFISPSGKYRLEVDVYHTRKGCWSYSRGMVYQDDRLIADIKRNFETFPYAWLGKENETHLYCGFDYQGQTIIDLQNGCRKDTLSTGSEQGFGFCAVGFFISPPPSKYMIIEGCIWGYSTEVRVYDISNPMLPTLLFGEDSEFSNWVSSEKFNIYYETSYIYLPGHPFDGRHVDDLTEDEDVELERELENRGMSKACETILISIPDRLQRISSSVPPNK